MSDSSGPRFLMLIHQIPPTPNYLRVKIGRRLQRLGAVAIKNSVYVLPRSEQSQEDFQWVVREIRAGGGDASVCEARFVEGLSDDEVEALFHAAREADYRAVAQEARALQPNARARRIDDERRGEIEAGLARLRKRMGEIIAIDFFGASGREAAEALLASIEEQLRKQIVPAPAEEPKTRSRPEEFRGRTWVTRKGIHVDRMASAWLVRRFIDAEATFKFVGGKGYAPEAGELRFDMFEAEFTHEGDQCTFEVLVRRLHLGDPALGPVAEIVHDIDLKDSKFGREETAGVDHLIVGIARAHKQDEARLDHGMALFDALYEYFRRKS